MGLFGRSRKEKEIEAAYMERINVPACMNQNFSLTIDDTFTIIGTGTVVTGVIESGMCRRGETAVIVQDAGNLSAEITGIDVRVKERRPNSAAYRTERVGLALRGVSREQIQIGAKVIIKNAGIYSA